MPARQKPLALPMQLKDGDFRSDAVPNPPAKTNAFVDVKVGMAMSIEPGRVLSASFAQRDASESWPINLPPVGVARQYQVTSPPF
jgi:hypothetical protein